MEDDDFLGFIFNGGLSPHGNRQASPQVHLNPTQAGGHSAGPQPPPTAEDIARLQAAYDAFACAQQQALANQNANAFGSSQHLNALSGLQSGQWVQVPYPGQVYLIPPAEAPPPPPHEGIRAGEVIGYRCWEVQDGKLRSVSVGEEWQPKQPMKAKDGDLDKGVGVFAYSSEHALMTDGSGYWCGGATFALGTVEMWGEIVEHEKGYRAEYAAVASITELHNGTEDELNELRHTYGLPFKPYLRVKRQPKPSSDWRSPQWSPHGVVLVDPPVDDYGGFGIYIIGMSAIAVMLVACIFIAVL